MFYILKRTRQRRKLFKAWEKKGELSPRDWDRHREITRRDMAEWLRRVPRRIVRGLGFGLLYGFVTFFVFGSIFLLLNFIFGGDDAIILLAAGAGAWITLSTFCAVVFGPPECDEY